LLDPVWSQRCSPVSWTGPKRFHSPPIELEALPRLDGVLISHDHYDHLDYETVLRLRNRSKRFYVALGVGAHLEHWGVPVSSIVELDWWQAVRHGEFTITATPARHFSGRSLDGGNQTLWAGWAVRGPNHNVFYSGDTAMFPGFTDIGNRLGPFDVALLETGQYNDMWRDVHLGPEQAVVAFQMLRAELYVPVHWGTFSISLHGWTEPVERMLDAAERLAVPVVVPRPGQPIEPAHAPELVRWWPELPYRRAADYPVMSSGLPRGLQQQVGQAHGLDGPPPRPAVPCMANRERRCPPPSR
jgi:L-ascorbate metabolism protein UlaG (beta-lactamase superfamily)